jgi:transposase-like protein
LSLPRYFCATCDVRYSRLTGTPLARLHVRRDVFARLLLYLTRPLAIRQAAEEIGMGQVALARLVRALRVWLLELDPTGAEEAKVRLGGLVLSAQQRPARQHAARGDAMLARSLQSAVDELRSPRETPLPAQCPDCGSRLVKLHHRANAHALYPTYRCSDCRRLFSRLTGTPLARSRWPDKQRAFVRYLGVPIQLTEVAEMLAVDYGTVRDWLQRYAELAMQLDPSGTLSARIRLAPALDGETCVYCGRTDALKWDDKRGWHCAGCGRIFSIRPYSRAEVPAPRSRTRSRKGAHYELKYAAKHSRKHAELSGDSSP